jgi:monoterpene epsilon-lactone hydrolase
MMRRVACPGWDADTPPAEAIRRLERLTQALRRHSLAVTPSVGEQRVILADGAASMAYPYIVRTSVNAGGVPAEWLERPAAPTANVLIYLHGGGYALGSMDTGRPLAARLCAAADARVLNVEYRIAPEHPCPAAVDDIVAAYRWGLEQGTMAEHVALVGDSAGGGLVVSTLVAIRERALPVPAAGVCLSPWVDLTLSNKSLETNAATDPQTGRETLAVLASHYLGDRDAKDPVASPVFADLRSLPPLLIQVGTDEVLFDDAIALGQAASQAGVDVTLETWDRMFHVWHFYAPRLEPASRALRHVGEWVGERWV